MARPENSVFYFDSTMPGAPAVSGQNGKLIEVLDACLVNGFGLKSVDSITVVGGTATVTVSTGHSAQRFAVVELAGIATPAALNGQHKVIGTTGNTITLSVPDIADGAATGTMTVKNAPAGWAKVFASALTAAFRSADGTGQYYRITDDSATTGYANIIHLCGFESMTGIATGSGQFPATAQNSGRVFWPKSNAANATPRQWCVVASSRFVYVGINLDNSSGPRLNTWLAFGSIVSNKAGDPYRGFVAGHDGVDGGNTIANSSVFWNAAWTSNFRFMARDFSGVGGACRVGMQLPATNLNTDVSSGHGPYMYPDFVTGGIRCGEINIVHSTYDPTILRGRLPGVLAPMHRVDAFIPDGTVFDNIDLLPGRSAMFRGLTHSGTARGVLFDLTGPWE